jgi:citronellyl-CoA dehydrogenase
MSSPFFTSEHEMFRQAVRDYAVKELAPHAEEWEEAGIFPREVFRRFGELGALGASHPERCGGSGGDWWYTVCLAEELVHSRMAGLNMGILVQAAMASPVIAELGTEEQIEEVLKPALRGEKILALGVSEPDAGSDVANIRTSARRAGDEYIVNGTKTFITNGTRADIITLIVKTDPEAGHGGISILLFPTDTKGFSVSRSLKKLGNWSSDTAELAFSDCRVPARYLLGEEGLGFYYLMQNFQGERLIAAVGGVAGAQKAIDLSLEYGRQREAFGRPILKYQVWRHQFVDLLTQVEAGRRLTYHACDLFNRKQACVKEVSMAKLYVAEMAQHVVDRCLQFHGGWGYMDEYDISRVWRDMRLLSIGGGTSEIMKEIIAKLVDL